MHKHTRNWLLFTLGWYIIFLILVPRKRRSKLWSFGFLLGFVQSVILNWITVQKYKLWRFPGDIMLSGIPLFTSLSWIATSMLFANFFPYRKNILWKTAYIVFFAAGTTIFERTQKFIGMWENIRWRDAYTFPLAMLTHTLMSIFLPLFNVTPGKTNFGSGGQVPYLKMGDPQSYSPQPHRCK